MPKLCNRPVASSGCRPQLHLSELVGVQRLALNVSQQKQTFMSEFRLQEVRQRPKNQKHRRSASRQWLTKDARRRRDLDLIQALSRATWGQRDSCHAQRCPLKVKTNAQAHQAALCLLRTHALLRTNSRSSHKAHGHSKAMALKGPTSCSWSILAQNYEGF